MLKASAFAEVSDQGAFETPPGAQKNPERRPPRRQQPTLTTTSADVTSSSGLTRRGYGRRLPAVLDLKIHGAEQLLRQVESGQESASLSGCESR